jgi:hypothetical protein
VCRLHGRRPSDRQDGGPSLPSGGYAEILPPRLRAAYESAVAVRGQLLRRDDVAILQLVLDDKVAELDRAISSPDLDDIVARAERMASEWRSWDTVRIERELAALDKSIRGCDRRDQLKREIRELTREKAALVAQVASEERLHDEFVSIDDVIFIVRTVWQIVQRTVRDPKVLEAIEAELRTILEKADDDRLKIKGKADAS